MKDTARDPDFCVVARVEALIAGWPMEEALTRAQTFLEAGELCVYVCVVGGGGGKAFVTGCRWRKPSL